MNGWGFNRSTTPSNFGANRNATGTAFGTGSRLGVTGSRFGVTGSRFGSSSRSGTYSFRCPPHVIFSAPKDRESNDLSEYLSSPNQSQTIFLLNPEYKFDVFEYLPRLFTITTNNGTYLFNIDLLKDTSSVIREFLNENPEHFQYHLNSRDEDKNMEKLEQLYQGKTITVEHSQILFFRQITEELGITPSIKNMRMGLYSSKNQQSRNFCISLSNFHSYLRDTYPKTFTITTKKAKYMCNPIGIHFSKIIHEYLVSNPSSDHFEYDFDDECNEFKPICDLFNFQFVKLNTDNMNSMKTIVEDLQIDHVGQNIDKFIEDYDNRIQQLDDQQSLIDSIDELFETLFKIEKVGVENAKEKIIESNWVTTEEEVQELAAFILRAIRTDIKLHTYLADLLELLDKESDESNQLKILLPFIINNLMFSFGSENSISSFVFILSQRELIQKDQIKSEISKAVKNFDLQNAQKAPEKTGTSRFGANRRSSKNKLNSSYVFFLPEIFEIVNSDSEKLVQLFPEFLHGFINAYFPENIESFIKMRESHVPDDQLTIALRKDDIDTFQTIVTQKQNLNFDKTYVPFNLFESFIENGETTYINYAAAYGSIKCFKYLLLNHASLTSSSFSYAVFGGNIEIVKIIDQKSSENKSPAISRAESDPAQDRETEQEQEPPRRLIGGFRSRLATRTSNINGIIPSITKHQNDLFDWILEQKFPKINENPKLLPLLLSTASENGNLHVLTTIVDKGFDFSSIDNNSCMTVIENAAKNGFYKVLKFLLSIMDKKIETHPKFDSIFDNVSSVSFGNIAIFKLYYEKANTMSMKIILVYAIDHGYFNIIKYIFNNCLNKFKPNQEMIEALLASSLECKDGSLFTFLIEEFGKMEPNPLPKFDYIRLLSESCYSKNVDVSKQITELILAQKTGENDENNAISTTDFTTPFLNAASSGSTELCQFFIEKKVLINFKLLSLQVNTISPVKKEILEIIIQNSDDETKEIIKSLYLKSAIMNKNKFLVEYLIKEIKKFNENPLFDAINSGDLEIVNLILDHKSDPQFINQTSNSGTPLNLAVKLNNLPIAKRLLSIKGIDPSLYETNNETPLITAISSFNIEMTNAILEFYGEEIKSQQWQLDEAVVKFLQNMPKSRSKPGPRRLNRPSSSSSSSNDPKFLAMLNRLLEIESININCHSNQYSLFSYACQANEIDIIKMLIQNEKVDVNSYAPADGNTPLIISILNNHIEVAKLLIECERTNLNMRNYENDTALTLAVRKKLPELVDIIISSKRFDPFESNLDLAFFESDTEIAKKLITINELDVNYRQISLKSDRKKTTNTTERTSKFVSSRLKNARSSIMIYLDEVKSSNFITTPLISAVSRSNSEKIDLIINHPSFDPIKSLVKNAIFIACNRQDTDEFNKLVKLNNNDVNIVSELGTTLLEAAVETGLKSMVTDVLNNETFDAKKSKFIYAFILSFCSRNYSTEIINVLFEFDQTHDHLINFKECLPNGKSFFTILNGRSNAHKIVPFLIQNGADPNAPDKDGVYPLEYAINESITSLANALIETGKIDFNIKLANNKSYLHLASCSKNEILSNLLNNKVIDVNVTDSNGETPLMDACRARNLRNIRTLFKEDDLDYLHCNNEGDDALKICQKLTKKEAKPGSTKSSYQDALLSTFRSGSRFGRSSASTSEKSADKTESNEGENKDENQNKESKDDDHEKSVDDDDDKEKESKKSDNEDDEDEEKEGKKSDDEDEEEKDRKKSDDEDDEDEEKESKKSDNEDDEDRKKSDDEDENKEEEDREKSDEDDDDESAKNKKPVLKFATKTDLNKGSQGEPKHTFSFKKPSSGNSTTTFGASKTSAFGTKNSNESSDSKPTFTSSKFGNKTATTSGFSNATQSSDSKPKFTYSKFGNKTATTTQSSESKPKFTYSKFGSKTATDSTPNEESNLSNATESADSKPKFTSSRFGNKTATTTGFSNAAQSSESKSKFASSRFGNKTATDSKPNEESNLSDSTESADSKPKFTSSRFGSKTATDSKPNEESSRSDSTESADSKPKFTSSRFGNKTATTAGFSNAAQSSESKSKFTSSRFGSKTATESKPKDESNLSNLIQKSGDSSVQDQIFAAICESLNLDSLTPEQSKKLSEKLSAIQPKTVEQKTEVKVQDKEIIVADKKEEEKKPQNQPTLNQKQENNNNEDEQKKLPSRFTFNQKPENNNNEEDDKKKKLQHLFSFKPKPESADDEPKKKQSRFTFGQKFERKGDEDEEERKPRNRFKFKQNDEYDEDDLDDFEDELDDFDEDFDDSYHERHHRSHSHRRRHHHHHREINDEYQSPSYQNQTVQSQWNNTLQLNSMRNVQFNMIMQQQQQTMGLLGAMNASLLQSKKKKKKSHK